MSTTTTNLGLTLPAGTDPADIAVLNTNFGLIDTFAGQQTAKDTSQDARMTAIENDAIDRDGRLTALETSDTTQNGRLTALETSDTSQNGRLTALETSDTTQNGRLTTLEQTDTTHAARLTAIEAKDTAQDTTIAKLVDAGAKNLLKITGTSQTIRNVTFTVNDDGTVTVDGTNNTTSTAVFYLNVLPADTAPNYNGCRLTGCPQGGSTSTYRLAVQLNSSAYTNYASDTGGGTTIHDVPASDCRVVIAVYPGATVDDLIFKPMICTAEDHAASDAFVPYTPTLRELYEMIQELQAGGGTT